MNNKYYKASDRFSPVGLILMILCTTLVGIGLSWVYLKINAVCPVAYLCILLAAVYGAAMGGVAYFFIKTFKLRSPKVVIISLCVSLVFTTYFKWALYDYIDRQKQFDAYDEYFTEMIDDANSKIKSSGANLDLNKPVLTVLDDFYSSFGAMFSGGDSMPDGVTLSSQIKSKETINSLINAYKTLSDTPGSDYKKMLGSSLSGQGGSSPLGGDSGLGMMGGMASSLTGGTSGYSEWVDQYLEDHPDASMWEAMGLAAILGSDEDEIKESINKLGELNIKEFLLDYRGEYLGDFMGFPSKKPLGKILAQPGQLFRDIKNVNKDGRWGISSRRSYSSTAEGKTPDNVKGFMLWLVWIGELLMINIPAFAVSIPKCQEPFIETDNDWAQKYPTQFKFGAVNAASLKSSMEIDPLSLFNNQALITAGGRTNYFTVTLYHSRSFMENYILVDNTTYDSRRKTYNHKSFIKYMIVDTEFVGTLFTIFGLNPPVGCHPSPMYSSAADGNYVPNAGYSSGTTTSYGAPMQGAPRAAQPQTAQPVQQPGQPSPFANPATAQPAAQSSLLSGGSLMGGQPQQPSPSVIPQPAMNVDADAIFGQQNIIAPKEDPNASGGINLLTGKPKEEDRPLVADPSGTSGFMDALDTSNLDLDNLK